MTVAMKQAKPRQLLLSLPDELLIEIISHLPPKSIIPLHSTSRRLRVLTRLDPTLWRSWCAYGGGPSSHTVSTPPRPSISDEEAATIDWYNEYKFRHAPTKIRWIGDVESPGLGDEVIGIGAFPSRGGDSGDDMVVSPMSDGSVRLWSLRDSTSGREVGRSAKGLVFAGGKHEKWAARRKAREAVVVDGVSVDESAGRAWIAGEEGLVEIDLTTLRKICTHRFPFSISTLSQTSFPYPLTVGTTSTLHLHDPRVAPHSPVPHHVHLFQPSPLSILHSPSAAIHVVGRFPSLLLYDRRTWPKLTSATYSGASLCGLTRVGPSGIAACGEYNGRGTLEVYPGAASGQPIVNRQTAARSKILTVASQGSYILTGSAEGRIRFFERDARTMIRDHWVDGAGKSSEVLWGVESGEDVVRKLKPLGCEDGEVLVWAGEQMGLLGTRREVAREASEEAQEEVGEEEEYLATVGEMLKRQGEEARILSGMGL